MRSLLALALALAASAPARAATRVELYTMGVGDVVFERFGHAALCVIRDEDPAGRCYNYGTTDFARPKQLVWDFIRGRARFHVSVHTPGGMVATYRARRRSVWRQPLPLAP